MKRTIHQWGAGALFAAAIIDKPELRAGKCDMHGQGVTRKIFIVSGAVFLVLLGSSVFSFILAVRKHVDADIQSRIDRVDNLFAQEMENEAEKIWAFIYLLLRDAGLQNAWLSRDKKELLRIARPVLSDLSTIYKITRFSFITPDRLFSFGLTDPPGHQDPVNRFVLAAAVNSGDTAHGIEIDSSGMLSLCVVQPWSIKGELAGYVELGEEIGHILPRLSHFLDLELIIIVDKKLLDQVNWKEVFLMKGKTAEWSRYSDFVEIHSTIDTESASLREYIDNVFNRDTNKNFHIKIDGRVYHGGFVPFTDAGGRIIGHIAALGDVSREMSVIKLSLLYLICSSIVVFGLLLVFLWVYFGRMENNLFKAHNSLKEKVEKQGRTEALLRENEKKLKREVKHRKKTEAELEKQVEHLAGARKALLNMMDDMEESKRHTDEINIRLDKAVQEANRLALEAELSNKAKSEFLANMSHEIRTPLNAVIGFSDLLSTVITDKKQKDYVDSINTSGKSLLGLINDILDLSKVEAGKLDILYGRANLRMIFNELEQMFREEAMEKHLEFIVDVDEDLPGILILDEIRIRQVLLNLLGNAVKFTEKGFIKLTAKKINRGKESTVIDLIIQVEDTGIGIPIDQQEIVFESFRQQEGQSSRKYGGVGLGLAITKRLVGMMNGRVSVRSEAGKGSIFEITLVDVEANFTGPGPQIPEAVSGAENILFEKARILVVDDVVSSRMLMNELLTRAGFEIFEAEDGAQALLSAQEYHPDLIIMDLRMPVMDGYQAITKLKKGPGTKDIPVIALTAFAEKGERLKTTEYGFNGYLAKPVNVRELFTELSGHLKHKIKNKKDVREPSTGDTVKMTSMDDIERAAELIGVLNDEVMPIWDEINGIMEMDSIEDFSNKLLKLAKKHKAGSLFRYAEELYDFVQYFDIKNIETTLPKFPSIVEEISRTHGGKNAS